MSYIRKLKKNKNLNRNIRDNLTNRIQEIEVRISGSEDTIKEMDTPVKENFQPINIQGTRDIVKDHV